MHRNNSRKSTSALVGQNVLINRSTGCLSNPADFYLEDYPYVAVGARQTIWKYMPLPYFEDLLVRSKFYVARADQFNDPWEGRLTPGNAKRKPRTQSAMEKAWGVSFSHEGIQEWYENLRKSCYISCWHQNRRESLGMWNWMAGEGIDVQVAIRSSPARISKFFPEARTLQHGVGYRSLMHPRMDHDNFSLFYFKPLKYKIEQEYRLLIRPELGRTYMPQEVGLELNVDLPKFLTGVRVHPKASGGTFKIVKDLVLRFAGTIPVEHSRFESRMKAG